MGEAVPLNFYQIEYDDSYWSCIYKSPPIYSYLIALLINFLYFGLHFVNCKLEDTLGVRPRSRTDSTWRAWETFWPLRHILSGLSQLKKSTALQKRIQVHSIIFEFEFGEVRTPDKTVRLLNLGLFLYRRVTRILELISNESAKWKRQNPACACFWKYFKQSDVL